ERAAWAGRPVADLVDDVHAFDDGAEDGVAPARRPGVEVQVVGKVNVKLARRRVRLVRARHADRAAEVAQAVAGLVHDAALGRLLLEVLRVAPALRDEPVHHPVEDRPLVVALVHVAQEVLDGQGRAVGMQLDDEAAEVGFDADFLRMSAGGQEPEGRKRRREDRQAEESSHLSVPVLRVEGGYANDSVSAAAAVFAGPGPETAADTLCPREPARQRPAVRRRLADSVCCISDATVSGPTPPATGATSRASSRAASNSTSPTIRPSSRRLMPTSTTTVPGLIQSPLTRWGLPAATISTSATRTCDSRSRVKRCVTVTVAPSSSISSASGRPTWFDA